MTAKEKILAKASPKEETEEEGLVEAKPTEKKKEEKKKQIICSFCGEKLEEDLAQCPYCQAILKSK